MSYATQIYLNITVIHWIFYSHIFIFFLNKKKNIINDWNEIWKNTVECTMYVLKKRFDFPDELMKNALHQKKPKFRVFIYLSCFRN